MSGAADIELGKLIPGVPYEVYETTPGLRASHLFHLRRSPAHLKAASEEKKEPTEALEFGRLFHLAMENPEAFLDNMVIEPVFVGKTKDGRDSERSAEAREKKAQWRADLPEGKIVLKPEWADPLIGMTQATLNHKLLRNLLKTGVRETSLWVKDEETDVTLQCRPDFVSQKGHMVDFKTTRDASKDFFSQQIFSARSGSPFYVLSAAHYAQCARMSKQCNGDSFIIIAIEKTPPYGINIFPLDQGCLEVGERLRRQLTAVYAECVKTNTWPGYPEKAEPVAIPQWAQWVDYDN